MTPTKISETHWEERVITGIAALIPVQRGFIKLQVPEYMKHRNVYLFLEAITTTPGEDFELEAELEFRKGQIGIITVPASIAENANATGLVRKSRITAFPNVVMGTQEALLAELSSPLANGSTSATMTPQKLQVECDEVWLNLTDSRNSPGNSFSGYRALLFIRSSITNL